MKQFKIPAVPPTTNKCIRIPNGMVDEIENFIQGKDCTFTAFVVNSLKIALDNLKDNDVP